MSVVPPPSPALRAAFAATLFEVLDAPTITLTIGMPGVDIDAWLHTCNAASATIITAWNPFSAALAPEVNAERQRALITAVDAAGLRWCEAQGRDPAGEWPPELSLCVFDAPLDLIDRWLAGFAQYAAVTADAAGCHLLWHPALR